MKVVILAGGLGTRISEESHLKPKPMIEVGEKPIIWHIMKSYSYYGFNDFVICCGYKGQLIKEYFANYYLFGSDVTFDYTNNGQLTIHSNFSEPWKVTVVDTGLYTHTGGRIKRIQKYVENETFMITYGDGVSNVNIKELLEFHKSMGKTLTITAVHPVGKFGVLDISQKGDLLSFCEKPTESDSWINGGFMVAEPDIFNYIHYDEVPFEQGPIEDVTAANMAAAYKHNGFWQCMDTQRDKEYLTRLWEANEAPWKNWE